MTYKDKVISVSQALELVQSDDYIVTGLGASQAYDFLSQLHTVAPRAKNIMVTNCLPMTNFEFFNNDEYKDYFKVASWFYTAALRARQAAGVASFIPNHLHLAASKRLKARKPNIYVGAASMPDRHGFVSLSLSNTFEKEYIAAADISILEINPNMPRTFGDVQVHVSQVDYFVESNYKPPVLPDGEITDKDKVIGRLIADYINDGDCIQLGIGGIPNAVADALADKKHLGVHTEMLTSGMAKLAKQGVIDCSKKNFYPGKIISTFILGTEELYDFVDDNTFVSVLEGSYTNDPYIIGQNDNQVSINTTIEVDVTGQCCSESIGSRHFSGTGGQADTAVGAQISKNGRSFIALYSTAMVKNKETGEREEISKIVTQLKPGAAVSLSRNDVDYVVTEYGVAALRGTSISERVDALACIAHPKFREQLKFEAKNCGII